MRRVTSRVSPVTVDIERDEHLTVIWDDGRTSTFVLDDLRAACPCAECRGRRDRGEAVWPRPGGPGSAQVATADTVGAWGLGIEWEDGHSTGIYTWDMLQEWDRAGDADGDG